MANPLPSKVTVRIVKRKLGDHYLDFMNANNPGGFKMDEDKEIDDNSISGILVMTALDEVVSRKEIKRRSMKISKLAGKKIRFTQALDMIAVAMGYDRWTGGAGTQAGTAGNELVVPNIRRNKAQVPKAVHAGERIGIDLWNWDVSQPLPENFPVAVMSCEDLAFLLSDHWVVFNKMAERLTAVGFNNGERMLARVKRLSSDVRTCRVFMVEYEGVKRYLPLNMVYELPKIARQCGAVQRIYKLDHPTEVAE